MSKLIKKNMFKNILLQAIVFKLITEKYFKNIEKIFKKKFVFVLKNYFCQKRINNF
jgi:hypothetical protein